MPLQDDNGKPVDPLTGEEVKQWRSDNEYKAALSLVASKWRKAVIALAALMVAAVTVWEMLGAFVRKAGG